MYSAHVEVKNEVVNDKNRLFVHPFRQKSFTRPTIQTKIVRRKVITGQ